MKAHIAFSSVLGIGYLKGGGTFAAIVYALIWYFLPASYTTSSWQILIIALLTAAGTYSAARVEAIWGKDSSRVVIDEVAGMAIALCFVPHNGWNVLVALVLFRFFDIAKPLGIRQLERWPGGWGVMADDALAGIYACAIMACLNSSHWWQKLLNN
jgi:phosphatidylglycerophosphatase A